MRGCLGQLAAEFLSQTGWGSLSFSRTAAFLGLIGLACVAIAAVACRYPGSGPENIVRIAFGVIFVCFAIFTTLACMFYVGQNVRTTQEWLFPRANHIGPAAWITCALVGISVAVVEVLFEMWLHS
jgi:hypothetical protein